MIKTMVSQVRMEQSFVVFEHADAGVSLFKDRKVRLASVHGLWPGLLERQREEKQSSECDASSQRSSES